MNLPVDSRVTVVGDAPGNDKDARPSALLDRWNARRRQVARESSATQSGTVQVEAAHSVTADSGFAPPHTDDSSDSVLFGAQPGAQPDVQIPVDASLDSELVQNSVAGEQALAEKEDTAPLLVDADMPAIETLSADSDLSGFFSKGVSAALRKAALRHVFQQPSFNVRDGLNDYDGDYTVFEPLGDTITSDMKFHAARKERERLEKEEQARLLAEEQQRESEAETEVAEEEQADLANSDESIDAADTADTADSRDVREVVDNAANDVEHSEAHFAACDGELESDKDLLKNQQPASESQSARLRLLSDKDLDNSGEDA